METICFVVSSFSWVTFLAKSSSKNADMIEKFCKYGVVVIPQVINEDTINLLKSSFHLSLKQRGCDVDNLTETALSLKHLSSVNGAGGILVNICHLLSLY